MARRFDEKEFFEPILHKIMQKWPEDLTKNDFSLN